MSLRRRVVREGLHERRERERRERRQRAPLEDGSRFETYTVLRASLPPSRLHFERADAITHARVMAMGAGLRVVDVVRADFQDDGDWLVELRVEAAG